MNKSKTLTHIPLGKLIKNPPKNVEFNLSKSANKFMNKCFLGSNDLRADDYIHYKGGVPQVVNDWGNTFDINLGIPENVDYALATILSIKMEWIKKLSETSLEIGEKRYKSAMHNNALETNIPSLYKIPVIEDGLEFFVSTQKLNLEDVNKEIKTKQEINLTTPLVKLKSTEDFSDKFEGTTAIVDGKLHQCNSVKVITEFDLNLDGAEVKQAAVVCLIVGSCASSPAMKKHIVIDRPFYVYTKVNNRLSFSSFVNIDSFIS
jgi:hypothetical protein